jgi:hypothetical protein
MPVIRYGAATGVPVTFMFGDYLAHTVPCVYKYNKEGRHGSQQIGWRVRGAHSLISRDVFKWFYGKESFRQGISLWSSLVDYDGNPRMYEGKQPGVKFVMNELLRMKPSYDLPRLP